MFTKILTASMIVAFAGVAAAQNSAKPAAQPAKAEAKPAAPVKMNEAQTKFEQIKKLAGVWQSADGDKEGAPHTSAIYRVTSGGSAVAETLMPGTEHEMVTMYTVDGDSIIMTHYCAAQNQPRMKSKAGGPSNVIAFEFKDGTGLKSDKDGHMHSLVLTFKNDDAVSAAWQYYVDGKPAAEHAVAFELVRVKDPAAAAKIITTAATSSCSAKSGATCCDSGVKTTEKGAN